MRVIKPSFLLLTIILFTAAVALQVLLAKSPPPSPPLPPSRSERITAEGRLVAKAGAETVIGSEIAGTMESVGVIENQKVHRGEVIARVRAADLRAAIAEAEARVDETASELRLATSEEARAQELWVAQVGTRQAYDRAVRDSELARARQKSARASLHRLEATLRKSVIVSPIDGVVVHRAVDAGEAVDVGWPVATIVDPSRLRVDAEVDELDVARIAIGAPVMVSAEGFEKKWAGRVVEVPIRVVGRTVKPADPAAAVDTRVLMVGVELLDPTPLKLGQRVDVVIGPR